MMSVAISACVPLNLNFLRRLERPRDRQRANASMVRSRTRTAHATGLSRAPWHCGQGRSSSSSSQPVARSSASSFSAAEALSSSRTRLPFHTTPKPRHSGHQPCGELYENKRGSSSSKASPHSGQLISVLSVTDFPLASTKRAVPLPISSARLTISRGSSLANSIFRPRFFVTRSRTPWRRSSPAVFFLPPTSPTTTSTVCSRKRSSFWKPCALLNSPSTHNSSNPCLTAHAATSVWKPFRALMSGASTRTRPFFAASSTCLTMAATLCFSTGTLQCGQYCVPSFAQSKRRK